MPLERLEDANDMRVVQALENIDLPVRVQGPFSKSNGHLGVGFRVWSRVHGSFCLWAFGMASVVQNMGSIASVQGAFCKYHGHLGLGFGVKGTGQYRVEGSGFRVEGTGWGPLTILTVVKGRIT